MGLILHDYDLERKRQLIGSAYEALDEGGAFVIIENLIDHARRENAFGLRMYHKAGRRWPTAALRNSR